MNIARLEIPNGEAGTDATASVMREMIEHGKRDQFVRQLAERIIRQYKVPRYRYVQELAALHDWVRKNVRYTMDPHEVEYIQTPRRLLQTRMGDCDDMTVLLGSLAEVIGHPVGIKVVSRDRSQNYHHVFPVATVSGYEYSLDASVPFPFGYQLPDIKKEKIYPSNGVVNMRNVYSGLGKAPPGPGGDFGIPGTIQVEIKDPLSKVVVDVLGPNGRICGPDVVERLRKGTIRPALPSIQLRVLSPAESGVGTFCVVAQKVSVYDEPILPPIPGLPPPIDITGPDIFKPPDDVFDLTSPITLRAGQEYCRPNIEELLQRGMIRAGSGTVLRTYIQASTGQRCVKALVPTDVDQPGGPTIFLRPPEDFRRPTDEQFITDDRDFRLRDPIDVFQPTVDEPTPFMPAPVERPAVRPSNGVVTTVVEKAQEAGPLGVSWAVWIGGAGLLIMLLKKK